MRVDGSTYQRQAGDLKRAVPWAEIRPQSSLALNAAKPNTAKLSAKGPDGYCVLKPSRQNSRVGRM